MGRIRVLPDILVKRIAAGEVIERPASVVKELMENAVDAGARSIAVTAEQGGTHLIRVTDDGAGMSADQLSLAVTPHATSKLQSEADLYRIQSLGFRGEALASIGAVSRMRLVSRSRDADEGAEIVVEGEQVQTNRAAGCAAGTTVEVRELFFNVPARRKFLRAAGTEFGHVNTQFARIALAHPRIAFELAHNDRVVHQLPLTASRRERIGRFYGRELGEALLECRRDDAELSIEAYAAPPADARSSAGWQLTFLNGRHIRDRSIQHAIKEAYRGLIDPQRYPIVFLFLQIDPNMVDVNVHPTKIEVRWQDSRAVHAQVLSALRETLQAADLTPALRAGRGAAPPPLDQEQRAELLRSMADEFKQMTPTQPAVAGPQGHSRPGSAMPPRAVTQPDTTRSGIETWRAMYGQAPPAVQPGDTGSSLDQQASPFASRTGAFQLHNTYLVCETEDGMVIIDQHALHERIIFERLKERIAGGKLESQRLLLPETMHVTEAQSALLHEHADLLERMGMEVTRFGPDEVAVQSTPALLKDNAVVDFLRDLLDKLEHRVDEPGSDEIIYDLLSMMACKAAVKAGDPLTRQEIDDLVRQKDLVEKSSNCPHGRPTTLRMTVKDLERQFKRT